MASPHSDCAGARGSAAVVAAPVVPGRLVSVSARQVGSVVVQRLSANVILFIGNTCRTRGDHHGAVPERTVAGGAARRFHSERSQQNHGAAAGDLWTVSRARPVQPRGMAIHVEVEAGN